MEKRITDYKESSKVSNFNYTNIYYRVSAFFGKSSMGEYIKNQNGNSELYARALDVARVSSIALFSPGTDNCK